MRNHRSIFMLAVAALFAAATPLASAQLYKWTDDKGVVNYSNKPPAGAAKGVAVVEDRVSVYTQDPAVLQATQNARERRNLPPPAPAAAERRAPPAAASPGVMATPGPAADPCIGADLSADCYGYGYGYGASAAFRGRHRGPRLVQPELTPGAIAGNVNAGGGFTPGLSAQAPLGAPSPVVRHPVAPRAQARDIPR
ncbi:MAG: hypothetical protein JWM26_4103 [Betaproteobacteria bacterium]|nr:hypothetical protein [Betaproteobacteria bacterium]